MKVVEWKKTEHKETRKKGTQPSNGNRLGAPRETENENENPNSSDEENEAPQQTDGAEQHSPNPKAITARNPAAFRKTAPAAPK